MNWDRVKDGTSLILELTLERMIYKKNPDFYINQLKEAKKRGIIQDAGCIEAKRSNVIVYIQDGSETLLWSVYPTNRRDCDLRVCSIKDILGVMNLSFMQNIIQSITDRCMGKIRTDIFDSTVETLKSEILNKIKLSPGNDLHITDYSAFPFINLSFWVSETQASIIGQCVDDTLGGISVDCSDKDFSWEHRSRIQLDLDTHPKNLENQSILAQGLLKQEVKNLIVSTVGFLKKEVVDASYKISAEIVDNIIAAIRTSTGIEDMLVKLSILSSPEDGGCYKVTPIEKCSGDIFIDRDGPDSTYAVSAMKGTK